jgi:hypothetical protein
MPEIGTSGSMSGDGQRSVGHRPQAAAPILDSTRSCRHTGSIPPQRDVGQNKGERDYLSLVSGFVRARTLSMKSSVARLSDLFFRVMIPTSS